MKYNHGYLSASTTSLPVTILFKPYFTTLSLLHIHELDTGKYITTSEFHGLSLVPGLRNGRTLRMTF